ncbi:YqaE/Pmp3 family membrane protein [Pseudovibrio ascidiaceicola]|uniref:YqaE/Pmp3 family membrane protein n=1 Tax=Pseudovibrio ascidiaceicola TaxID=285279 RepID=UPI003D35C73C
MISVKSADLVTTQGCTWWSSLYIPAEISFMRLILAILLPFVVFFTINRPFQGIFCLLLQITLIGWIPAAIWAVYALGQYKSDKKIRNMQRSR